MTGTAVALAAAFTLVAPADYTNWDGGVRANAFVNGGFLPAHVRGTKLEGEHSYVHLADWCKRHALARYLMLPLAI